MLELVTIRDVRFGSYSKSPKVWNFSVSSNLLQFCAIFLNTKVNCSSSYVLCRDTSESLMRATKSFTKFLLNSFL